ncbi:hypothetical protein [Chryseobacterium daeguense]|uniref:hypothetical protein n=1 Tax=Chryseobacterium daeguense TaxID=412438 RepID=UPI0003FD836B|nr:hypothetical protein [Chryseobacterium daeguense]
MYSISKKIKIGKRIPIATNTFVNDEIGDSVQIEFVCCTCDEENMVKITPYETGFPVFQLYDNEKVLSKGELLENGILSDTSKNMLHFGELTVNNLPTLYFGTQCRSCNSEYICVFGYGEKQPSLTMLMVSGIWNFKK